jgi:hypothetical protein
MQAWRTRPYSSTERDCLPAYGPPTTIYNRFNR